MFSVSESFRDVWGAVMILCLAALLAAVCPISANGIINWRILHRLETQNSGDSLTHSMRVNENSQNFILLPGEALGIFAF